MSCRIGVHRRHTRWAEKGVWERVFKALADDPDNEYAMIDSTIVRAHQHAAGQKKSRKNSGDADQCIGRSKGGLTMKIHALCDALGNPLAFFLSGGNEHDLVGADALLEMVPDDCVLIADKAYYAGERVIDKLEKRNIEAVIPSKSTSIETREIDQDLYNRHHLIENFFARLKHYRAIATRYDKRADVLLGAIHLAAIVAWLN